MAAGAIAAAAAASAAGGASGGLISYGLNKLAATTSWDRQKNLLTRGPTYQMSGLRKAGLNPILAAGSSGIGARAPQAASASMGMKMDPLTKAQHDLLRAQTSAQGAMQQKLAQEGWLAQVQMELAEMDKPKRAATAALFSTPKGAALVEAQELNTALPNTAAGLTTKIGLGLGSKLKELFVPSDPYQGTPYKLPKGK